MEQRQCCEDHQSPSSRRESAMVQLDKKIRCLQTRKPMNPPPVPVKASSQSYSQYKTREKQCFSPEVYELGRHVILSKRSTVDMAVLPPKKMRVDEFNFGKHHAIQRPSCEDCKRNKSSRSGKADELKRLMPPPKPLALTNYPSNSSDRDGNKTAIPNFSIGRIMLTDRQRPGFRSLLFPSSDGFPWDEWAQSSFSLEKFREILLSGRNMYPVRVIETEDHIFIKMTPARSRDCDARRPGQKESVSISRVLTVPFTLPFRVISSVFKWIVGSEQ